MLYELIDIHNCLLGLVAAVAVVVALAVVVE
jgi:hypothetical protein